MIPANQRILVGDLHLDRPWPDPPLGDSARYGAARLLVRRHQQPLGEITVPLDRPPTADILRRAVLEQLGDLGPDVLPDTPAPRSATVVIATRERPDSLERCLGTLAESDHPFFDVVVVDSAPTTPRTHALVREHPWPFRLSYVRADRPGLGYAHDVGIPRLTGEVAAFTDDDVEIDRRWLTAISAPFGDPAVACVTGLILPAELETYAQRWIEDAGGFARGYRRTEYRLDRPTADRLFPFTAGRFGSGANMAFRSEWLRARGGFDPATGAGTPAKGGDDLDAFLRVVLDGQTLVYEPGAIVRHHHRRDYESLRRQAYGYGVGLGAYLTAAVRRHPLDAFAMGRRAVPALRHLLAPGSARNASRGQDFPAELIWRERLGVCVGPAAYAWSRWRYREVIRP
ncbi:glycosyltransferase family 2 protein [Kribbella sp. WER1]